MSATLIVEANPGGHRFQYVAHVAAVAARSDRVILVTSAGARERAEFEQYLAHLPIEVQEPFDGPHPATREVVHAVAELCRHEPGATVVVTDVDQLIKRWWLVAPKAFRGVRPRPRIVLLLTRLPSRLTITDRVGWLHKISKTVLAALAFGTGTAHRVVYLAGRDDLAEGRWLKRVRDPAICTAHSDDRDALRSQLGLPLERRLVGILGGISGRKNVPLVAEAVQQAGPDVDLLLAGTVFEDVETWLATLPDTARRRVIVRDGFLSNEQLDAYVAACDVAAIAHDNNAPSGIMGKAVAAGVPVLSAGSKVRLRECTALRAGIDAPLTAAGLADGIRHLLRAPAPGRTNQDLLPTGEEFGTVILGRMARARTVGVS